jgi:hypothetical protein
MAKNKMNIHRLLGNQRYSCLYGGYTEVLHNSPEVLKESAGKGRTAKTIITAPPSTANSVSEEDESGNLQTTPTKEP